MPLFRRLFRHTVWWYVLPAVIGLAIVLMTLLPSKAAPVYAWSNALTTAGGILTLLGLLGWVSYLGAFDTFGYSFSTFGSRRYENLTVYSRAKQEKRRRSGWTFVPSISIGLALLLIGGFISLWS